MSALHYHGFMPWTGTAAELKSGEGGGQRRPGPDDSPTSTFLGSSMPPMQLGHYLLRRNAVSRDRTWTTVDPALNWMADIYRRNPPVNLPAEKYVPLPLEAYLMHSRPWLLAGTDALWEYYLPGFSKIAYAVICCPHAFHGTIACPLPPA